MPRSPRLDLAGVAQHVIQRRNDRQACFFREAGGGYLRYLQDLRGAACKYGCRVQGYVMMTNHVHMLMTPSAVSAIARMRQAVGRCCARCVNDSLDRTGTLWEGMHEASLEDT